MIRPTAIGLAPNLTASNAFLALRKIVNPFGYNRGVSTMQLEKWFERSFGVDFASAFTSGRGALYAILKAMEVGKGDEVVLQAFTCAAVVQAILSTGAKPIYVDIDTSLTIDPKELKKNITPKTKAIIIQHTFGIPADVTAIQAIAKQQKIFLIEDVAHSVGAVYESKKLGTFADASIFSFGRDKAISATSGGMVITNNTEIGKRIKIFNKQKSYPSKVWTCQQLLHPIAFYFFILPFYNILLGKIILVLLQRLGLLSLPVDTNRTILEENEVKKLPVALSAIVLQQLADLKKMNNRRISISRKYSEKITTTNEVDFPKSLPLLRYPILMDHAQEFVKQMRKKHIYLGTWYSNVIDPKGVNFKKLYYVPGSCPNAERIAKKIINIPTYPSLTDKEVARIILLVNSYASRTGNQK